MQSRNMANFELKYKLSKMWDETLRLHNTYCLEIEDSIQKLEILRKLEGTLKKLLCMVQQDRKFLLPETLSVLKQSIKELHQFNGDKAISAFEAINQYATNLLTKPWRKEFRTIKLHSGFYHLNIKTNLVNAEKLFEAMGYRQLSKDTMVLNGPLCPELVASVSRDAITACFELQIMQSIYVALYANGMTTSWLDIFCYRETHIGGISDAIVDLIRAYEKSSNQLREDNIGNCGYRDVPNPNNSFHSAPQIEPNQMMYQFPMPSNKKNVNTTKMYENSGRRYNANGNRLSLPCSISNQISASHSIQGLYGLSEQVNDYKDYPQSVTSSNEGKIGYNVNQHQTTDTTRNSKSTKEDMKINHIVPSFIPVDTNASKLLPLSLNNGTNALSALNINNIKSNKDDLSFKGTNSKNKNQVKLCQWNEFLFQALEFNSTMRMLFDFVQHLYKR